jgi:integrase/recombinase XerD
MEEEVDPERLINMFTEDLKTAGKSKDTILTYPYTLKAFCKFVKGNLLGVTREDLRDYLNSLRKRNLGQSSIERYFVVISEFYKFLIYSEIYKLPNPITDEFKRRYLKPYKGAAQGVRKCPTTPEVIKLVNSIVNTRDLAIVVLLFKTGIRRKELSELNRSSVDLKNMTIRLEPTAKRTNRTVFIDDETAYCLGRYLKRRSDDNRALFLSKDGSRLGLRPIDELFQKHVKAAGLYNGEQIEDKLTPHCARHWFTTELLEANMSFEHVQFLRGDKGAEAASRYHHINLERLKESYQMCMPRFGLI